MRSEPARSQQGVVECLVEQPEHRRGAVPGRRPDSTRKFAADDRRTAPGPRADRRPVEASTASCHNPAGKPGASAKRQRGQCLAAREPSDRAEPLQVPGQRGVHCGVERQLTNGSRFRSSCRPWLRATSPATRKLRSDISAILRATGPAIVCQRMGCQVARRQPAAGKPARRRLGHLRRSTRASSRSIAVSATAKRREQMTALSSQRRVPTIDLGADVGACLRQRQHDLADNRPCLGRAGGLVKGIDDHVEPLRLRSSSASRTAGARSPGSPGRLAEAAGRSLWRPQERSLPWRALRRPPTRTRPDRVIALG